MDFPKIGRDSTEDEGCINVLLNHVDAMRICEKFNEGNATLLKACATRLRGAYIPLMDISDESKQTLDKDLRYLIYYLNIVEHQSNITQLYLERAIEQCEKFEDNIPKDQYEIEDVDIFLREIMPEIYEELDKAGKL